MDFTLSDGEIRILGCLIEKELTTPEYYPLSLNALMNACNQKTNRDPVVSYDEPAVAQKLELLQRKGLAGRMLAPGSRVPKYLHAVLDRFDLSRQELSVLCELMLRGPQTAGEIRSRAERMTAFENLEETERILQSLIEHDPPLAAKLPREAGRKEHRYTHLFAESNSTGEEVREASGEPVASVQAVDERLSRLEREVSELRREIGELKRSIAGCTPQR